MTLASGLIRMHIGTITGQVIAALPERDDQRDLSIPYERMGTLADQAQEKMQADEWFTKTPCSSVRFEQAGVAAD